LGKSKAGHNVDVRRKKRKEQEKLNWGSTREGGGEVAVSSRRFRLGKKENQKK